jgi:hypothetical protein
MKRRTRLGGLSAVVGDLRSSVRRARDARQTRVRTYDASARPTTLDPASNEGKAALSAANQLLQALGDLRKLQENGRETS